MMQKIIEKISRIKNGFKPIEFEAKNIFDSNTLHDSMTLAKDLLKSEIYQVRCLAVFILGFAASADLKALNILKTEVSRDSSWQVQEILAKSFDQYCNNIGYEKSIVTIKEWLGDSNPNVCRAVTEGLRIWTSRPYFKTNPEVAIHLISQHKSSDSEYLRKSVGNSLRDISKKHKELIDEELLTWDLSDKKVNFVYKLVTKNQKK
jgi:3-methyladenine DNA glycosylase AlkD